MPAKGSRPYLLMAYSLAAVGALVAAMVPRLPWIALGVLTLLLALLVTWFFRDPERRPGPDVVSPADGRVIALHQDEEEARLTIFMTPWSVHVNRSPLDGRIEQLDYHRGAHVPAFKKESDRNERLEVDMSTAAGPVRVRLIAGTVARRIHPYVAPGVEVKKGDRIGLIAFGSRCELVLPGNRFRLLSRPGDWVRAGETTVARRS